MQNYKKISKHKEKCSPFGSVKGLLLENDGIMAVTPYYIYSTQTGQAQHTRTTSPAHQQENASSPTLPYCK